jgi:hypothetical protein
MKWLLALLLLAGLSAEAETVIGSWNLTISPSSDEQKILLKIQTTGTVYLPSVQSRVPSGMGIGYAGMPSQPASTPAWNIADAAFFISPIGYITNSTTGFSRELNHITFTTQPAESETPGANVLFLGWRPGEPWFYVNTADVVTFNLFPNPVEFELDLAFSNFNAGVYSYGAGAQQNILEIVPEPSSLSLLLAGGAVLTTGRRRESD